MSLGELVLVNGVISGLPGLLESRLQLHQFSSMNIVYDDIAQLNASKESFTEELSKRTGKSVQRYRINNIDLLRETIEITVIYKEES